MQITLRMSKLTWKRFMSTHPKFELEAMMTRLERRLAASGRGRKVAAE